MRCWISGVGELLRRGVSLPTRHRSMTLPKDRESSSGFHAAKLMSLLSLPRSRRRLFRRVALVMAVAILFAGIAQAAHFHKDELAGGATDVHCLLCLFAASTAGPPAIVQPARPVAARYCNYRLPSSSVPPLGHHPVPYEARGPPLV